jgi:hypothetical protein
MEKTRVNLLQPPDYTRKINYGRFWASPKITQKGSDHIREKLNPYGENPNFGENGDRRVPV